MTSTRSTRPFWLPAALVACFLLALTRIPLLRGAQLVADGDEAVVGLMARQLTEGEGVPIFFAGQRYGLSIVETALAAGGFELFGVGAVGLKAAMLPLFLLGVLFFAGAARRLGGDAAGWLCLALLAIFPAWGGFALKARGGYLTAFALAGATTFVCVREGRGRCTADGERGAREEGDGRAAGPPAIAIGLLAGALLAVQPLWLLPLVPLCAWRLLGQPLASWLRAAACALVPPFASWLAARVLDAPSLDWSPSLANRELGLGLITHWPRDLWEAATGAFYLRETYAVRYLGAAGLLWTTAILVGWLRAFWPGRGGSKGGEEARVAVEQAPAPERSVEGIDTRSYDTRFTRAAVRWLVLGALLGSLVALPTDTPRYLLPTLTLGIVTLALALAPAARRTSGLALAAAAILLLSGHLAYGALRGLPMAGGLHPRVESERAALTECVDALHESGVRAVWCDHHLLQWILLFASDRELSVRWHPVVDRFPGQAEQVERAYAAGERTAWVGYLEDWPRVVEQYAGLALVTPEILEPGGRYFILLDPAEGALRAAGFERPAEGAARD